MARKMKKFSEGGAQGRYSRRMADIDKDFAKDSKGKSGKALEVLEAKRAQRTADAKDDLAKRTGADRTATRAAEKAAEGNLTKTRKYGAAQSVTKDTAGPTGKVSDTLGAVTALKSGISNAPAKKPADKKAADKPKPSTADTARNKFFQDSLKKTNFKTAARMAEAPIAPSKFDKAAFDRLKAGKGDTLKASSTKTKTKTETARNGTSRVAAAADPKDTSAAASRARAGAALSYLNPFSYVKGVKRLDPSEVNKAKGGTVKKETTMSKKPMPMGGKQLMPMKKKPTKEPITGGADTVPLTPGRKEFLKELAKRNAKPGMAKGGKATKFGAAMVKKSADTKGRAMVKKCSGGSMKKYASGGLVGGHKSADGIAKKGKTKGKMV